MAQKRNIILCGTESFSRGELDNVALENGAIVLDEVAGQHVLYGCYTSPELAMPPFSSLNVSWNADTPHGTVVEAQCRILAAGAWSGWKSLGKWSPEYPRAGAHSQPEPGDPQQIFVEADTITVGAQGGGQGVQLRIYLYTDDELATPAVRLLSAFCCCFAFISAACCFLRSFSIRLFYRKSDHFTHLFFLDML